MIFVLRIFDLPDKYLVEYKQKNIFKNEDSFEELMNSIFSDAYGQSNCIGEMFNNAGYESIELLPNFKEAQVKWALEQNRCFNETNWKLDILEHQIEAYKPDILIVAGWNYGGAYIKKLKDKFKFLRKIIFTVGESLPSIEFLEHFDIIITHDPNNVNILTKYGKKAFHIYHAFNAKILKNLVPVENKTDIIFAGSLKYGVTEHNARAEFLFEAQKQFDLKLYTSISLPDLYAANIKGHLAKKYHELLSYTNSVLNLPIKYAPRISSYHQQQAIKNVHDKFTYLKDRSNPSKYGMEYFEILSRSKAVINVHSNTPSACNMRLFEVTGIGTCLLTDNKKNINQLFEPNKEVLIFKNKFELFEQITFCIQHPEKALEIGKNSQKRILKDHTYANRTSDYLRILTK